MRRSFARYYLSYDQVGSLRIVADISGNVVKRIYYDAFGNIIDDTNPDFYIPIGFAGGLHDRDTGLVRFGYRDYDPDIGRWLTPDPIGFAGGDVNIYRYVNNDPINWVDPEGLIVGAIPGIIFGGIAGVSYSIFSQIGRPGGINWCNVAEATVTGALFGAISGASFGLGSAALYGLTVGSGSGIFTNVFIYDYPDVVHYPWEEDNPCSPLFNN